MSLSQFVISIDTELLWGAALNHESKGASILASDPTEGRGSIKVLLDIFKKYELPATWAIVGHLLLNNCDWQNNIAHPGLPRFKPDWFTKRTCSGIKAAPQYYGTDIVASIMDSEVGHEIGYHSFSHVPFDLCSEVVAEAELDAGIELAKHLGISFRSFVFPYNHINHTKILNKKGFKIFRDIDAGAIMHHKGLAAKFKAGRSRIVPSPVEVKLCGDIWSVGSSMTCTDAYLKLPFLPRAIKGLNNTMRSGNIFHLTLHPHDLIHHPGLSDDLDTLGRYIFNNRERGRLNTKTMGELVA